MEFESIRALEVSGDRGLLEGLVIAAESLVAQVWLGKINDHLWFAVANWLASEVTEVALGSTRVVHTVN